MTYNEMTHEDPLEPIRQLIEELAILELDWTSYDYGRGHLDGIQHTRRDGSTIVITDQGGPDTWYIGFYTAEQHADLELHEDAEYVECVSTADVIQAIITRVAR